MTRHLLAPVVVTALLFGSACRSYGYDKDSYTTSSTTSTTISASTTTQALPSVIEVKLAGGQVVGGPRTVTAKLGSRVTIRAQSDVAEELHLHTYDLSAEIRPSVPSELIFKADIPGRFEVEFEQAGKQALTLEVR